MHREENHRFSKQLLRYGRVETIDHFAPNLKCKLTITDTLRNLLLAE